ncbi:lipopolysaccharide heptosyltransferase II [Geomobilimonas luticola]|uniref:lipopolysaccharide heptosyltransferase II n=1 Tax=Geomobilimonas luticola TaxID=1114878 RepID=A0ABS5SGK4_9BACT|nr:lipopolysaccharide heptosyltransferase II [Geomobilimonas luticola]MBT0653157.1 lipopolysaccharide heptosyltransferase II [Geomobilimonas luticola]
MVNAKNLLRNAVITLGNRFFRYSRPPAVPDGYCNILVFCRMAIGDIVMAIPSFRALRHSFPNARIVFVTMEWNREVVRSLDYFDEVVYLTNAIVMHRDIGGLLRFIVWLRTCKFDMAVLLDTFLFPFYCYMAGIPVRVGYEFENEGFALTHKAKVTENEYRLHNFLKVVGLSGAQIDDTSMDFPVKLDENDSQILEKLLPQQLLQSTSPVVGIVAGGGRNPGQTVLAKNWTTEGFAQVALELIKKDDAIILLFGKGEDDEIATRLLAHVRREHPDSAERIINVVNKTSLMQAAALLQKCDIVVTNDTALMHLAAAVGTPTVSIFGPTSPANLAPRGNDHRVVQSATACSPCYESQGYLLCRSECMKEIAWYTVYKEAAALLQDRQV